APRRPRPIWADVAGHGYDEFLDSAERQQHNLWWSAVFAVVRLLFDLRVDAYSEPDARLVIHAGRLCRRKLPRRLLEHQARLLAGRHPERHRRGGVRRIDGTVAAAPAYGRPIGPGAGYARHLVHGRRFLPDGLGRRSDFGRNAGAP